MQNVQSNLPKFRVIEPGSNVAIVFKSTMQTYSKFKKDIWSHFIK